VSSSDRDVNEGKHNIQPAVHRIGFKLGRARRGTDYDVWNRLPVDKLSYWVSGRIAQLKSKPEIAIQYRRFSDVSSPANNCRQQPDA
jgi:hypothetical protein